MLDVLFYFALVVAVILTIGETLVLVKTDKYWPLSLDDYAVCALLAFSAFNVTDIFGLVLMLVAWAFMAGNLYAMLFTRMDPNGGTRERLGALAVLLLCALAGGAMTALELIDLNSAV
ncbi:hypothetical protein [Pseudoteredinibacter isoporae]|uniref:Uncharacterized protein n=1 Tax=Pseudoteredinibacter isoporae TaxID=570281 RepID=A0A7X0JR46_9GAMM|nr:hypothetical protein [Pseudoteredinibacter isoporae]MBB6520259.1 hypothetical protein [Pseudoteredinibacter isoporae]NHO85831.1 hypothetical protein [Pseudoteredinibacter isoporae]NIB25717.1 hypothetical protein [Pseudoteredinibacter isoporae]